MMAIRTLLTLLFFSLFINNTLLGQEKSINEWKNEDKNLTIQLLLQENAQQNILGLTNKDQLEILSQYTDQKGFYHVKVRQMHNGIPVIGAHYLMHEHPEKGTSRNGLLIRNLNINTNPSVTESDALLTALDFIKANQYAWQNQKETQFLHLITNNTSTTYFPKGELVIIGNSLHSNPAAYRLAYQFEIYALQPISKHKVYIDAQTGQFIKKINLLHHIDEEDHLNNQPVPASGETLFYGQKNFQVTSSSNGSGGINYTMKNNACELFNGNSQVLITNTSNSWMNQTANTAYHGLEKTHNYFKIQHDRYGYAGDTLPIKAIVHWGNNMNNAFWNGQFIALGDGTTTPYVGIDILTHEWVHGLIEHTAQLAYQGESGAINEAICDIFGIILKNSIIPNSWEMGSEIGGIRDLSNPNAFYHPDTYKGTHWYTGGHDGTAVHTNSGVMNHWFYLLAQGGNGTNDLNMPYSVTSIGLSKAADIVFKALNDFLLPYSQYDDVRLATLEAAKILYGSNSSEYIAVSAAWCAVGLGGANANFTITDTLGSLNTSFLPSLIDNSLTYSWDFGDGTSSSSFDTVHHSYANDSVYLVQLIVQDGCGFADTSQQVIAVTTNTDTLAQDSLMLVKLFYDTGGPTNWDSSKRWDLTRPVSSWSGVYLTENKHEVDSIILINTGLVGHLSYFYFPKLITLYLQENELVSFKNFKGPNSEVIALSGNELTEVQNLNFPNLTSLSLYNNNLITVPGFNFPNLTNLSLSSNELISVPNFKLPNLTNLSLSSNNLTTVPNFKLPNLTHLFLKNNELIEVPNFYFPKIEMLDLNSNELTTVPNFNFPKITHFFLTHNPLVEVPPFSFPKLRVLNLSNNRLVEIPNFNLPEVSALYIHTNQLNFDDLESKYFSTAYPYDLQDSITTHQSSNKLYVEAGGNTADNTYKWYKNNTLVTTNIGDSAYLVTSSGHYRCEISNSVFTRPSSINQNLILYSQDYHFESCITHDSTLLLQFADTLSGQNWSNVWDTTQSIFNWQGVYFTSDTCSFDSLNISYQNVQGTIPDFPFYRLKKLQADSNQITGLADFQFLDSLNYLSLDSNSISNLPDTSHFPMLDTFHINHNKLIFSDLLPYLHKNITNFQYADQDSFFLIQIENQLIADVGDAYHNTFEWYLNNQSIATNTLDSAFSINSTGYYKVKVTNSILGLTLWSNTFQVHGFCDADFSFATTPVCEGMSVIFNNQTINTIGATYDWQVNGVSKNSNATFNYIFNEAGTYEIKLISTIGNCSSTHIDTISIHPNSSINLAPADESICTPTFAKRLTARAGMNNYSWEKNNQIISSFDTCTVFDHDVYTVIATDFCGNTDSNTTNLYIGDNCYVWAGDCNNDGIVNGLDWLTWGLAFGDIGMARLNADTLWRSQLNPDWENFINGVNSKYADTNGDGKVNFADTIAIIANFGKTNSNYNPNAFSWDNSPWNIKIKVLNKESLPDNKTKITIGLFLENNNQVGYSVSLSGFNLDINVIAPLLQYYGSTTGLTNSSLGIENTDIYTLQVNDLNNNIFSLASIRPDNENQSSMGFLGQLGIIIEEPISTGDTIQLKFSTNDPYASTGSRQLHSLRPGFSSLTYISEGTGFTSTNFPVEISGLPASCSQSGSVTVYPLGNAPYTYLWNTGDTSQTLTELKVDDYSVTVTDVLGHTGLGIIKIEGIDELTVTDTIIPASSGLANGGVKLGIHGGSGYYSIKWNNGNTTQQRQNLATGSYMITVTDDTLGCSKIHTITIGEEPVPLQLTVFLEGAYDTISGIMHDSLNANDLLPLEEPFSSLAIERPDTTGEVVITNILEQNNIVDWILIELRDQNYPSIILRTRAALLKRNGAIVDMDGQSPISFDNLIHQPYYIALRHRNHLSIMTASAYHLDDTGLQLDFTNQVIPTYGNDGQKIINGKSVMYSGDSNSDGIINASDQIIWKNHNGTTFDYLGTLSDFNLDGQINAVDRNLFWKSNQLKETQTPK